MAGRTAEDSVPRTATGGLSPLVTMGRRESVMNEIRRAVVRGDLRPGQKLTENWLATSLQVSRPTMREALTQLAQEGVLVQEPYRGIRVADLDPKAIMDIARTRVALDMLAAQDILADPTGRRLELVREAWADYDRLPIDADPITAHEAHLTFHRRIWEAAENTLLTRLWPVAEGHLTIVLGYDQATRDDARRAHAVHEALVDALVGGDLDEIHRALIVHTIDSAAEIVELMSGERTAAN